MKKNPKGEKSGGKGGYRPGAGRKPTVGTGGRMRSIWMDDERWETIKRLIKGETMDGGTRAKSISRWIVEAVDQRLEQEQTE